MQGITDPTFELNHQALAVLHYLAGIEPNFAEYKDGRYDFDAETKPWYNGRERGFILSTEPSWAKEPCLNIAVFEHRNSDQICTLKWETQRPYRNYPDEKALKLAYPSDGKWDVAATFDCGKIGECAEWIYNELKNFYKEHHIKLEENTEHKKVNVNFCKQCKGTGIQRLENGGLIKCPICYGTGNNMEE